MKISCLCLGTHPRRVDGAAAEFAKFPWPEGVDAELVLAGLRGGRPDAPRVRQVRGGPRTGARLAAALAAAQGDWVVAWDEDDRRLPAGVAAALGRAAKSPGRAFAPLAGAYADHDRLELLPFRLSGRPVGRLGFGSAVAASGLVCPKALFPTPRPSEHYHPWEWAATRLAAERKLSAWGWAPYAVFGLGRNGRGEEFHRGLLNECGLPAAELAADFGFWAGVAADARLARGRWALTGVDGVARAWEVR